MSLCKQWLCSEGRHSFDLLCGYNAGQLMTDFSNKGWTKSRLLLKLRKYHTFDRCPCSRKQYIARTGESVDVVESRVLSQDNANMDVIFGSFLNPCNKIKQILAKQLLGMVYFIFKKRQSLELFFVTHLAIETSQIDYRTCRNCSLWHIWLLRLHRLTTGRVVSCCFMCKSDLTYDKLPLVRVQTVSHSPL